MHSLTERSPVPLRTPPGGQAATFALTALAPASWGTTYVVTTHLLPPGHPLFAGLMRALPAGLLALAITRVLPRGDWWWKAAVLGVLNIGGMPCCSWRPADSPAVSPPPSARPSRCWSPAWPSRCSATGPRSGG